MSDDDTFAPLALGLVPALRRMAGMGADGNAPEEIEQALADIPEKYHDAIRAAFTKGIALCESPIERAIFPWLLCQTYSQFDWHPMVLLPGEQDQLPERTVAIVPQLPIGRFRADFALAAKRGGPVRFVIVECDGAEFHKDVHRDVARDHELLPHSRILDVHAITGKEIAASPRKAAEGASRALTHAWSVTNRNLDKKFGAKA